MLKNQTSGPRTKHIDIAYRFANSFIEDGSLKAKYIRSADNPADIMTKNVEILGSKHSNAIYEGLLVKSTSNEEDDKDRVLLASGLESVTVVRPTGTKTNLTQEVGSEPTVWVTVGRVKGKRRIARVQRGG